MFDDQDKRTLMQLTGLWVVAVTAILTSLVLLGIGIGIAYSAFKLAGGL